MMWEEPGWEGFLMSAWMSLFAVLVIGGVAYVVRRLTHREPKGAQT